MDFSIKRVVIAGVDRGLGDTLLMTPVFRALREVLPTAYLEAWVNWRWRCVVSGSPYLNCIRDMRFRPREGALLRLWLYLRRYRPDAMIILLHSHRFARLARWAGIRIRAGRVDAFSPSDSLTRLLTHIAPLHPWMHRVEHNLFVAEKALDCTLPRYRLTFTPAHRAVRPSNLNPISKGCYAVLHLGTGGTQPPWPPERFAQAGLYLAQKYGLRVVLSGGVNDILVGEKCYEYIKAFTINTVGKLSIEELAEVLSHARLLISVDTGVVHLAAAVGTPCVVLYPRKDNPPHRWYPWQVHHALVSPTKYCAECTDISCQLKKDFTNECILSLYPEQIFDAIDRLIHISGDQRCSE